MGILFSLGMIMYIHFLMFVTEVSCFRSGLDCGSALDGSPNWNILGGERGISNLGIHLSVTRSSNTSFSSVKSVIHGSVIQSQPMFSSILTVRRDIQSTIYLGFFAGLLWSQSTFSSRLTSLQNNKTLVREKIWLMLFPTYVLFSRDNYTGH